MPGHILNFTEAWASSQAMGYKSHALSIPAYDSQEDFDRCRPGDAGQPFEDHNDFMSEIVKGLSMNGVPTEIVAFHWEEFDKWLAGRPVEPSTRSQFAAHLSSQKQKKAS
ncbi:MAG TPA: hypothetical protein VI386_29805 [Candidatus Sulfotelmatobacter sp.]